MRIALIRLSPGPNAPTRTLSAEIATDILWAAALPDDRLEHVRIRHSPDADDIDVALFHIHGGTEQATDTEADAEAALCLCHRAIGMSPMLAGWLAEPLTTTGDITPRGDF
jgi:hypothetical protein